MKRFVAILTLLCVSCAQMRVVKVDSGLQDFVQRFETAGNIQVDSLVVKFGDTGAPQSNGEQIVGYCQLSPGLVPTVVISTEYFNEIADAQREELIFHELGHCVLDRGHTATALGDGCPSSIMDPYTLDPYCYSEHYEYYKEELFQTKGKPHVNDEMAETTHVRLAK